MISNVKLKSSFNPSRGAFGNKIDDLISDCRRLTVKMTSRSKHMATMIGRVRYGLQGQLLLRLQCLKLGRHGSV